MDDGWKVAMGTLAFERGASTLGQQLAFRNELDAIIERRPSQPAGSTTRRSASASPTRSIALRIMRWNALRVLSGRPSAELPREAMITKLFWATWHRDLGELAMDVLGAEADLTAQDSDEPYDPTLLQRLFLFSRADTIYGGSNQIQRNIIGERALGLPPRAQGRPDRPPPIDRRPDIRDRPDYVPGHGLLAGKTVVVTAAAGTGIGSAVARKALEEGATVLISDAPRAPARRDRRRSSAEETGTRPATQLCNVTVRGRGAGASSPPRSSASSAASTC